MRWYVTVVDGSTVFSKTFASIQDYIWWRNSHYKSGVTEIFGSPTCRVEMWREHVITCHFRVAV